MLRGCRLGRGWMLGGSVSPSNLFIFFPSSIDQYCGEGGSSDVAVKLLGCVRVQLSQGRRKQGIKRSWKAGEGRWTDCVTETRPVSCTPRTDTQTHRHGGLRGGRLQREIIMERQTRGRRCCLTALRASHLHFIVLLNVIIHFKITAGDLGVLLEDSARFSRVCYLRVVLDWTQVYQTDAAE